MNESGGMFKAVGLVLVVCIVGMVVIIGGAAGAVFGWLGSESSVSATPVTGMTDPLVPAVYEPMFQSAAQRFDVPEALLLAVGAQESSFDPNAESSAGATGMMQMLPASLCQIRWKFIQAIGGLSYAAVSS